MQNIFPPNWIHPMYMGSVEFTQFSVQIGRIQVRQMVLNDMEMKAKFLFLSELFIYKKLTK